MGRFESRDYHSWIGREQKTCAQMTPAVQRKLSLRETNGLVGHWGPRMLHSKVASLPDEDAAVNNFLQKLTRIPGFMARTLKTLSDLDKNTSCESIHL